MKCIITLASFKERAITFQYVKKQAESHLVCEFQSTGNRRDRWNLGCLRIQHELVMICLLTIWHTSHWTL